MDLVLIPEIQATLEGERGVLGNLDRVLARKGHAVVVVAEGAAQELMEDDAAAPSAAKPSHVWPGNRTDPRAWWAHPRVVLPRR